MKPQPRKEIGLDVGLTIVCWIVGVSMFCFGLGLIYAPLGFITFGLALIGVGGFRTFATVAYNGVRECPPSYWGTGVTQEQASARKE